MTKSQRYTRAVVRLGTIVSLSLLVMLVVVAFVLRDSSAILLSFDARYGPTDRPTSFNCLLALYAVLNPLPLLIVTLCVSALDHLVTLHGAARASVAWIIAASGSVVW